MEGFADRSATDESQKQNQISGFEKIQKIFEAGTKSVLQCKASLIVAR